MKVTKILLNFSLFKHLSLEHFCEIKAWNFSLDYRSDIEPREDI